MRKVKSWVVGGLLPMLVMGLTGSAIAAPKGESPEFDASIAAADSSVVSNDGNSDYAGRHPVATIQDYKPDTWGDVLEFSPYNAGRGRTITFQHPSIEGNSHVMCEAGKVFFLSGRAPSTWWEEVLEHGSTMGQAVVHCNPGDNIRYRASFPIATEGGAGECVSFAKTGDNTFAISAEAYVPESTSEPSDPGEPGGSSPTGIEPIDDLLGGDEEEPSEEPETTPASGCPATIDVSRWEKGDWAVQSIVKEQSAPFLLELRLR